MGEINAKSINDSIIRVENNDCDNYLKIYCKINPDQKIMNIIRYLKCNGWKDFKFNQYSVKKDSDEYVVNIGYVRPKTNIF